MSMKLKMLFAAVLIVPSWAYAALESLNNEEMVAISGKGTEILGGADLSWTLSLNHQYASDLSKKEISLVNGFEANGIAKVTQAYYRMTNNLECPLLELCRLAISPNNHTEKQPDGSIAKKWLVFKQIQGTLQIDQFTLSGTTFINQYNNPQSAMRLTFYDDKPLKIRNLGFKSLSIEAGDEGYFNTTKYETYATGKNVPQFDQGQEKGFMGLNIHGNMHMNGNIKIFSVNCTGDGASRC